MSILKQSDSALERATTCGQRNVAGNTRWMQRHVAAALNAEVTA